jgi:hypothetical protein
MPIKHPELYPDDWKDRRAEVLKRAGDRCECRGECGHNHAGQRCAAPNRRHVYWFTSGGVLYWKTAGVDPEKATEIVLTTAHRDHELVDHELDNLAAMCQRCHLAFDRRARKRDSDNGEQLDLERAP